MSKLNWISDEDLYNAVTHLLQKAEEAQIKSEKKFGKNVIDPFSAIFVMSGFKMDFDNWLKTETSRQAQKTLQNHIGEFHQKILGHVEGWDNMKTGNVIDLVSNEKKIIAEVKNKHNTISGGKLSELYYSLERLVMPKTSIYKNFIAYYVTIIPKNKKRKDLEFTPSDKDKGEKCPSNKLIREIDGASFYELVTGDKNALNDLFKVLPSVIEKCTNGKYKVDNFNKLQEFFNQAFE